MKHIVTIETLKVCIGEFTASFLAMHRVHGVGRLILVTFRHTGEPDVFGIPSMPEHEQQFIINTYRNHLVNLQRNSEHSEALRNCDVQLT